MAGTQYRGSEIKDVDQFVTDAEGALQHVADPEQVLDVDRLIEPELGADQVRDLPRRLRRNEDVRNVAGLIVRPSESGVYYLRISLQTTVATPQEWAVIYAYR